ncbi:uncharacterized protein N7496_000853 [Penicillium cataractarum]|uniref:Uncharacterized protein n=1 Tax=Penicillium cataractarum TaxID=2100454 RepID=A0A9W9VV64_9EURO|nr:uncharacterized protein N7496_000853 [Penicillium cataractarum]KAJ5389785.1 hypothetical protein N7496_000853 [Penicillium cataractarum]
MSSNEESLRCRYFLNDIKGLSEMKQAIASELFPIPQDLHAALHSLFENLRDEHTPPLVKQEIENTFRNTSLQQKIEGSCKLSRSHHDENSHQHMMDDDAPHDLASWSFKHCSLCSNGLLDHKMIQPSSYLFWIAFRSERTNLSHRLLSLVEPEDLLVPFATGILHGVEYTMFQVATWKPEWFQICWKRLQPLRSKAIASLGSNEKRAMLQWADVELVDCLFKDGLDIGNLDPDHPSLVWLETMSRGNPEPMLEWLLNRGIQRPEKLLVHATRFNYIGAARWMMGHNKYSQDWREAAVGAAKSTDYGSAELMAIILEGSVTKLAENPEVSQNLVITVVERACLEVNKARSDEISGDEILRRITEKELLAVRKIEALGRLAGAVDVVGTKVMASEAKLDGLLQALENMELY